MIAHNKGNKMTIKSIYNLWMEQFAIENYPIRGKCKEATDKMISKFPELRQIRGHVRHILSEKLSPHWWCIDQDNNIVDPTAAQFVAIIEYIPHDETQPEPTGRCPNCGEYCYDYKSVCSDECGEEYKAYIIGSNNW